MKKLVALLALGLGVASLAACEGYSESLATSRCDAERAAHGMLFNDSSYQQCLDCMQSCGDECQAAPTSPVTYACAEESN
jgi:hypothetical protein